MALVMREPRRCGPWYLAVVTKLGMPRLGVRYSHSGISNKIMTASQLCLH